MSESDFSQHSVAVVVGASRGIGLALSAALAEHPRFDHVLACARDPDQCAELQALIERSDGRVLSHAVDVTRAASVSALGQLLDRHGFRPALVLNVAGLLHQGRRLRPEKRLEDIDLETMQAVFAVNALGPALVMRELMPRMAPSGKRVFAALSARVGSIGDNRLGGWYAYRSSKAALNQLLKTAAIEARRRFEGLVVAALHPGTTDTSLSRPFQGRVPEDKLFSTDFVARRLLAVIEALEPADSGGFFAWDGQPIPW